MAKRARKAAGYRASAAPAEHPVLAEPLTPGSVLAGTFGLLGQAALPIALVLLVFQVPWIALAEATALGEAEAMEYWRWSSLYDLLFGVLASGAITLVAYGTVHGKPPSIGEALRGALRAWGPLLLATILSGIITLVFLLLLVVPGVLKMLSYALIAPVVVLERTGGRRFDPLGRSTALMLGHRKPAFFALLVLFLLSGIPTLVIGLWGNELDGPGFRAAGDLLGAVFNAPLEVAPVVLYLKAKRAFDANSTG